MQPRRALLLLVPLAAMLGGCWHPGGPPPEPEVVQETEPNNTTAQANALPLAPDSAVGSIVVADDPGRIDYWTYTPSVGGVLDVQITCVQIIIFSLSTASQSVDGQCLPLSLALDAGEQVFVGLYAVTPNPSYTLSATFTPGP